MSTHTRLEWNWAQAALALVAAGALLNALIAVVFPPSRDVTGFVHASMLGDPQDLEADLIEFSLAFPPLAPVDGTAWPFPYDRFTLQNSYHIFALDLAPPVDLTTWAPKPPDRPATEDWEDHNPEPGPNSPGTVLSALHVTPLSILVGSLTKRAILRFGPNATVALHLVLGVAALALLCRACLPGALKPWLACACLLVSAPCLLILARGNQGALLTGLPLCGFVFLGCSARRPLLAALLLALACNVRPNAVVLAPLLACYGVRDGLRAGALFALVGAALLATSFALAAAIYPGYGPGVFLAALHSYYHDYVLGAYGAVGNNSAFSVFKLACLLANPAQEWHPRLFHVAGDALALFFGLWLLWAWRLFARGRMPAVEFAFVAVSVYVLASPVIATNHLIVLAAFLLWYARPEREGDLGRLDLLVLFTAAFVLMPKSYFFVQRLSPEVLLNPLALMFASWRILSWRAFHRRNQGQAGGLPSSRGALDIALDSP